jgi:D-aspartate ligase
VLAVDHRRSALGFRSRYAEPAVGPDAAEDGEAFARFLASIGEGLDSPAPLFPTHDPQLNAAARHADVLDDRFLFPFPGWPALEPLQRKRHQLERAAAAGVPIPRTFYPDSAEEARAAGGELGFPLLVKPSRPAEFRRRFRRQAFFCRTVGELVDAYERAAADEPMLQEFVPGGDELLYTLGSYVAKDGEALALFSGRKLRQTTSGVGTCRVGEAVWVDEVVEQGLALLRAVGFHGISQVEFKRDPRDGAYKLMEINPRLWQWHGLAAATGVDIPWIAYCDLTGRRLPPARMRPGRRRWAITLAPGSGPALVRPPYVEAVLALDDPKPFLVQVARVASALLAPIRTKRRAPGSPPAD